MRQWTWDLVDTAIFSYSWACSWPYYSSPVRCLILWLLTQICLYETAMAETIPLSCCHWSFLEVSIGSNRKSWVTRQIEVATTLSIAITTSSSIEHGCAIESWARLVENATFIDIQLSSGIDNHLWYVLSVGVESNTTLATTRWSVVCPRIPKGTIACCRWPLLSLDDPLSEILPHFETYMLTSTSLCTLSNSNVLRLVHVRIELGTLVQICIAKYCLRCRLWYWHWWWPAKSCYFRWRIFSVFSVVPDFSWLP